MTRLLKPLLLFLTTLLVVSPVISNAQTFYVSTQGADVPTAGSQQNPWATISYAIDRVAQGAVIEVAPGTYNGRVELDRKFSTAVTVRSATAYKARLRHNAGAVITCFSCAGIVVEGFDVAHAQNNSVALVIQIQNTDTTGVVLRNNIIHDSTNNDLLKVNNGARNVRVVGNMFYNQSGSDEHIDVNSTEGVIVEDNVFFNTASQAQTSSFVVIKDSNGNSDGILGNKDATVRRNVFLNWQGSSGQSFLRIGEDNTSNFEADGVLVENNLMIGNSSTLMRSAMTIQGARNITVRSNTVVGDLPSRSFAARLLRDSQNQANTNVIFSNNIWSDPSGTMGQEGFNGVDVFEAFENATQAVTLNRNLFFNGGNPIPTDQSQEVRADQDLNRLIDNPGLPTQLNVPLPVWDGSQFGGGQSTIREVFLDLVQGFGVPGESSPVVDQADSASSPADDIRGAPRSGIPDIGCFEQSAEPLSRPSAGKSTMVPVWLWSLLL